MKRGKLYDVTHRTDVPRNKWCGPAALSAVTGKTAEWAAAVIGERRNRSRFRRRVATTAGVQGVSCAMMARTLADLGLLWRDEYVNRDERGNHPSLARWLRERTPEQRAMTAIVVIGHHYVAVSGNRFADSVCNEIVTIRKAPGRRKKVSRVFWIRRPGRRTKEVMPKAFAA